MRLSIYAAAFLASAGMVAAPAAAAGSARSGLNKVKALNLIVLQNYAASADVEGKTYVGGNISGSATLGIGASANPGQTANGTGFHSTLAVGGSSSAQINLNAGAGAISNYGAIIGGSLGNTLSINATGGTVRIGGSYAGNLNLPSDTTLVVSGGIGGLSTGTGENITIGGTISGNTNLGSNSSLSVTGAVNGISGGSNDTIRVGGSATSGNYNLNSGSSIAVAGSLANINLGANSINKVGGSVSNVNGASGAALYAGGAITGNQNSNGATFVQNYGWTGGNPAPAIPVAPVVPSLTATTAQLDADVKALSAALGGLTIVSNPSSITYSAQGPTFHAVGSGGPAPFALFTVDETIFNFAEVNYDFAGTTLPVVINVVNSNAAIRLNRSATYNWNLNPVGGANNAHNQQVIWNFTDASTVNLNRQVQGSILAPYATVANSGDINGSVVAKIFNQSGEVHLGTYARSLDFLPSETSSTPEPATWVELILGFGFVGAVMRRRKRFAAA